jgi:multidrug efflux pump subunit AcrA (membrane-fusion protein)
MELTLSQVRDRLYDVHQDLSGAQRALRVARDAEVQAAAQLRTARARAFLDAECPRPKRGENGVTVAERDTWIDNQTHDLWLAHAVAEATRKAAEDALRVARDQGSVVQSLAGLMKAEMSLSGTGSGA